MGLSKCKTKNQAKQQQQHVWMGQVSISCFPLWICSWHWEIILPTGFTSLDPASYYSHIYQSMTGLCFDNCLQKYERQHYPFICILIHSGLPTALAWLLFHSSSCYCTSGTPEFRSKQLWDALRFTAMVMIRLQTRTCIEMRQVARRSRQSGQDSNGPWFPPQHSWLDKQKGQGQFRNINHAFGLWNIHMDLPINMHIVLCAQSHISKSICGYSC